MAGGAIILRHRRRLVRPRAALRGASTCPTPPPAYRPASSKAASPTTWCWRTAGSTEIRNLPGTDGHTAIRRVVAPCARAGRADAGGRPATALRWEDICAVPSFLARADEPAVRLARRLAAREDTTLVAFGTGGAVPAGRHFPPRCAGPASSPRRTRPTNTSAWSSWRCARLTWTGSSVEHRQHLGAELAPVEDERPRPPPPSWPRARRTRPWPRRRSSSPRRPSLKVGGEPDDGRRGRRRPGVARRW